MRALGIIAAVVCFLAGLQMWIIRSGEIECYHAIGTYFIAKGLFILFITESKEKKNQKTG